MIGGLPAGPAQDFPPLATPRLHLRPLAPADAETLHRLVNDWEVARNLERVPFPYPRDLADEWIADTARQLREGRAWHLGVIDAASGALIGLVGLRREPATAPARPAASLGYWIGRRWWGQGFATEAAGRLARFALAQLDLDRLTAHVAIDNPASAAVLRRIGFVETGEAVHKFLARSSEQRVRCFEAGRDEIFGAPAGAEPRPAEVPPPGPHPAGTHPAETPPGRPMILVAACALIDAEGRVLLARRPEGKKMAGLWEFPGGKLDPGETPEAALVRELHEELGIDVSEACLAPFAFASHAYPGFHLLMPLYLCRRWQGTPAPREGQTLAWVRPQRLADYPMPPADKPLVPLLRDFL